MLEFVPGSVPDIMSGIGSETLPSSVLETALEIKPEIVPLFVPGRR